MKEPEKQHISRGSRKSSLVSSMPLTSKKKTASSDIKREVLIWAAASRIPESMAAVLSVRKMKKVKVRGKGKDVYQLCLAVQNPPLPSRILVLKGESAAAFKISEKHTFRIKDIRKVCFRVSANEKFGICV